MVMVPIVVILPVYDNVIQMNELALNTTNPAAINQIYNTVCGEENYHLTIKNLHKGHFSSL